MLKGTKHSVRSARRLRRELSLPEGLIWRELRQRPSGLKFRRQHPAGPYVIDFFCADALLGIEIDGIAHGLGNRPRRDQVRDAWLGSQGIDLLRVPAADVLDDLCGVLERIIYEANSRLPLHHPADGPPPRSGEE